MANINFSDLVESISYVHNQLAAQAGKAVNISLTIRNWLIGMQIHEYELRGQDRAEYGESLFAELARHLQELAIPNSGKRQLYQYVAFYRIYPQIVRALPAQFRTNLTSGCEQEQIVRSATAQFHIDPEPLIQGLSYTHLEQLVAIDDPLAPSMKSNVYAATGRCESSNARSPAFILSEAACHRTRKSWPK